MQTLVSKTSKALFLGHPKHARTGLSSLGTKGFLKFAGIDIYTDKIVQAGSRRTSKLTQARPSSHSFPQIHPSQDTQDAQNSSARQAPITTRYSCLCWSP